MLIGAHVSTGGGLTRALERGEEMDAAAIQIFSQNPRMWRPTRYTEEDRAEFRGALAGSQVDAVVIHAVYLINCASRERQVRSKSLAALVHALRLGDDIGAVGVVLHPGTQKGEPYEPSMKRVGQAIRHALSESESCSLLLEDTAGAKGTLGRDFPELSRLIELGGDERIGACLDCCHLLASGFEIRTPEALAEVIDDFDSEVGLERLGCLHVNDSQVPLGGNRDRHANLGEGELGRNGIGTFLAEPRFKGLPAILEVPGRDRKGPDAAQVALAKELRRRALADAGRG